MTDRTVRVLLQGDATSLVQAANAAEAALNRLGRVDTTRAGAGIRDLGSASTQASRETGGFFSQFTGGMTLSVAAGNLAAKGLSAAFGSISGAISSVISSGIEYQDTLLNLGAITQSSGDVMTQVAAKARELGKDITIPGASAADAATAMTELAKGGLSVAASMTAAKGTLQLAAAASIDAGKAAEIQVNAMNAFHLSADQAGHVADVLANVANAASGEITDFASGLTAAGATAHSFGISLEETNTVLGLFANAGIKGEEGGTLLKTMLVRLAAAHGPAADALKTLGVTAYDASGNFEGMEKVTEQLAAAHGTLTQQAFNAATAVAFGTRGIKGAAILATTTTDAYNGMSSAINRTGSAEEIATAKMSGLSGSFENFKNQMQDLELTIFSSFAPQLTQFVNAVAASFPDVLATAGGALGEVAAKTAEFLSPIIDGVRDLAVKAAPYVASFAGSVKDGLQTALDAVAPFGEKLASLFQVAQSSGIIDALGLALTGVGHAFSGVMDVLGPILAVAGGVISFFTSLPGPVEAVALAFGAAILLIGPLNALFMQAVAGYTRVGVAALGAAASVRAAGGIMRAAGGIMVFSLEAAGTAAKGLWAAMGGWVGVGIMGIVTGFSLLAGSLGDTKRTSESAAQGVDGLVQSLKASKGAIDDNVRAQALAALKTQQWGKDSQNLTDYSNRLGLSLTDQVNGLVGVAGAADKMSSAYDRSRAALQAQIDTETLAASDRGSAGQAARDKVAQLQTELQILDEQHAAYQQLAGSAEGASAAAAAETAAVAGAGGAAADATAPVAALSQAQQDFNAAATSAVDPIAAMKDTLKDLKGAADDANTAGQFLWATMEEMSGGAITAQQAAQLEAAAFRGIDSAARSAADAHQKVTDAQTKLDEVSAHLGGTLDGQAVSSSNLAVTQADVDAASRALADAQSAVADAGDKQTDSLVKAAQAGLDAAGAAYAHKAALGDLKGATDDAAAATQAARDQFIKAQTDLGMTSADANALADSYHLIPSEVVTTLQANGLDEAQQKADNLNKTLTALGTTTYHFAVQQDGSAQAVTQQGTVLVGAHDHADGGWITGSGGPRDDKVKANLSPGEFVVNAASAGRNGALLTAINDGRMGFADGGPVPAPAAAGAAAGTAAVAVASTVTVPDVGAIQAAWSAIAAAVQTAWTNIIGPTLDLLRADNAQTAADFLALQTGAVEPSWVANGAAVSNAVNTVIVPAYALLNASTDFVGADMHLLYDTAVLPVWSATGQLISDTVNGPIASNYAALNTGSDLVGQTFQSLAGTTDAAWGQIGSTITATYNNSVVPAWQGVQSFADAAGSFFTNMAAGVGTATAEVTDDIGKVTSALNEFFTLVDGKASAATAAPAAGAAAAVLSGLPAKADGGLLSGPGGPRDDKMVIRASPGEYVVNAAATAKNLPALHAMNYGGAFADGGMVGAISGSIHDAIVTGTQAAIGAGVDKALASVPAFGTSTASGFNASQDPSTFGWVRAANISPYSWNGNTVEGGVAGGTQGLWNALLTALVPQIPGGLNQPMYGYENRDNVNNPGVASFHSYGLAVDVNAASNPNGAPGYGRSGNGVIPSGPAHSVAAQLGMLWGGDFNGTPDPMHFEIHVPPGGISAAAVSPAATATGGSWLDNVLGKVKSGGTAASSAAGNQNYSLSGGVEQWRGTVLQSLQILGQSASLADTVLHQMDTESSGNPNAINNTDSNAAKGTPSKGLVQVIDPTFRTFAVAPYNQNIWDPLSNILAGENYAIHQYGSIAAGMRGVAYDNGGPLPPGFTMAYNGTGQMEQQLTNSQWATASRAVDHVTNAANGSRALSYAPTIQITNYVDAEGILSRTEAFVDGRLIDTARALTVQVGQS